MSDTRRETDGDRERERERISRVAEVGLGVRVSGRRGERES